jgi:hypothetical protein
VGRKYGAGAAASHPPSSAGVEPVNLDDRRRATLARLRRAELARTIAELEQDVDHTAAAIARSMRAHPSNPKPYDREAE